MSFSRADGDAGINDAELIVFCGLHLEPGDELLQCLGRVLHAFILPQVWMPSKSSGWRRTLLGQNRAVFQSVDWLAVRTGSSDASGCPVRVRRAWVRA